MENFVFFTIKYTFVYVCAAYAYCKLMKCKLCYWDLFSLPLFVIFSAALYFVDATFPLLNTTCHIFTCIFYFLVRFRHEGRTVIATGAMALGLSVYLKFAAYILSTPITVILFFIDNLFVKSLIADLIYGLVQILCIHLIFKLKALKNGICFTDNSLYSQLLTLANILCVTAALLLNTAYSENFVFELGEFAVTVFGLIILYLYRKNSVDGFIRRQLVTERGVVENNVETFGKQIYLLEADNRIMAEVIHRDNKIFPAERAALLSLADGEESGAVADMLKQVTAHHEERAEKLSRISPRPYGLAKTGVPMIDSILFNLQVDAEKSGVFLETEILCDAEKWFSAGIPDKTSVNVLLSYLGDNAIRSAKEKPAARVKITLGKSGFDGAYICVCDNGAPFNEKVISNMGVARVTTRKDGGGNGFGLQTLFETVRRFDASFTLDELCNDGNYTKRIEICFDGRHKITLRTNRACAAKAAAGRSDFTVIYGNS